MDRYATVERLGRKPTLEDIARIHNGGPNGWKKKSTDAYWAKVKKELDSYNIIPVVKESLTTNTAR